MSTLLQKTRDIFQKRKSKKFEYAILHFLNIFPHLASKNQTRQQVFEKIFNRRLWLNKETVSGPGSTFSETEILRQFLPQILKKYAFKTMVDAGCGDCHWLSQIDLGSVDYTGIDIVPEIITENNNRLKSKTMHFIKADVCQDSLPSVDLVFARDILVHLSKPAVLDFLANVKKSGSKYLLTTTFHHHKNINIQCGGWRPINLEIEPFNLGKPIDSFSEALNYPLYKDKSLGLWIIN